MNFPPKMQKIWNTVGTVIVVLVVIAAVFLMGARLVGLQVYNVVSDSMRPTYNKGDLLYVKAVDPDSVRVGDPITFVLNENLVVATHRVVAVDGENRTFTTKGDANESNDKAPVHFNNLIGVPQFSIPMLGYVSDYIQHPPGTYVAIGIVVVLLALAFLPDMIKKKETPEVQKSEEETK